MCNVPTDEIIKYIMPVHLSEVGTLAWLQNVLSIILECFEKCKEPFLLYQRYSWHFEKEKIQKYRNYISYAYSFINCSYACLIIQLKHVIYLHV